MFRQAKKRENMTQNKVENEEYTAQVDNIILEKNRKPWKLRFQETFFMI